MRVTIFAAVALLSCFVSAQELEPYPRAQITREQWQKYYDEVSSKHVTSRDENKSRFLVVFHDSSNYTNYVFTTPGHAAHPAWVTRVVLQEGKEVSIKQFGYFAGDEKPFAELFRSYQQLNAQIRQDFERRGTEGRK